MADFDFAIVGSTPFCAVLAGLLAGTHSKAVALIGEPASGFRLMRGVDLSVSAMARPESWALLKATVPETAKLLARIGGGLVQRVDPLFVAHTAQGAEALAHMRHVGLGYGWAVEKVGGQRWAFATRVRDAMVLSRREFEAAAPGWLEASGARRFAVADTRMTLRRDGSGRLEHAGEMHEVKRYVLADDAAILALIGRNELDGSFAVAAQTTILTEPMRNLVAPVELHFDLGVALRQHRGGAVTCLGSGAVEDATRRIRASLEGRGPARRAGQVTYHRLLSRDGAPIVGSIKANRSVLVAGFAEARLFFAPAIARLLAGVPQAGEERYFAERAPSTAGPRAEVADLGGAGPAAEAAA